MVLVAPIRHPMEVAMSLTKRNGYTISKGLALWEHYNRELLKHGCRFVGFPSQDGLEKLVDDLGLVWTSEASTWMDPEAIHHAIDVGLSQHVDFYREILSTIEV
jgi:hypothetical protein